MLLVCWEIDHYLLIFKRKRGVFHWFFHISWKVICVFSVQYRGFDFIQWWYLYLKFLASILYFDLFDGDIVTLMQMLIFLHSVFEKIDFIRTMNKNVNFLINKMINLNVLNYFYFAPKAWVYIWRAIYHYPLHFIWWGAWKQLWTDVHILNGQTNNMRRQRPPANRYRCENKRFLWIGWIDCFIIVLLYLCWSSRTCRR